MKLLAKLILIVFLFASINHFSNCEISSNSLFNQKHNRIKRQIESNDNATEEPDGNADIAALIITGNLGGAPISEQDSRLAAAFIAGNIGEPHTDIDEDEEVITTTTTEAITQANDYNDDYTDDSEDDNNQCSVDSVFDSIGNYFPDDYEESKRLDIKKGVNHMNETSAIIRRLSEYGQNVSEKLKPTMKRVMPRIMETFTTINLPPDCLAAVMKIGQSLQDGEMWAAKFLDSMGGIPTGLTQGVFASIGEYDQCLSIESPAQITPTIYGQYCLSTIIIPYPPLTVGEDIGPVDDVLLEIVMKTNGSKEQIVGGYMSKIIDGLNIVKGKTYRHGLCLPSNCRPQDVEQAINEMIFPYLRVPIEIGPQCDTKHSRKTLDSYQVIAFSVFGVILLLMLFGTVYELMPSIVERLKGQKVDLIPNRNTNSGIGNVLMCFSVIENNRKLFAPARELSAIEGIRFISSIFIFFVHEYFLPILAYVVLKHIAAPYGVIRSSFNSWRHLPIRNFNLTDLYFFLGGLLSSYIFLIKLEQSKGRFNYIQIVILRWIRIAGPMIGSILVIYVMPLLSYGPIWNDGMDMVVPVCHKYWYRNLMFTNNFLFSLPMDEFICNTPTWYTSCDFQLFLITPFLIYVLYRYGNYGLLVNLFAVFVGCVGSAAPRLFFDIPLYFEWTKWRSMDQTIATMQHTLYAPYAHLNSVAIGIITGYFIRKYKTSQFRLTKYQIWLLWVVLPSMTLLSMVWLKNFFNRDFIEDWEAVLWAFSSRVMFVSGVAWICFACSVGHGGFANKFLSWYAFIPLSRLTIGIYLLHPIPMLYRFFSETQLYELTDYKLLTVGTFDFIITIFLAYLLFLMFDCPTANLTQMLLKKSRPVSADKNKTDKSPETINTNTS